MEIDIAEFTFNEPLYKSFKIDDQKEVYFLSQHSEFHGYNPVDKMETTFHYHYKSFTGLIDEDTESFIAHITVKCLRSERIFNIFVLWNKEERSIMKVGQYPSVADFHIARIKDFQKVLSKDLAKEFTKAIGLAAHGVGIGSFVYLRRIFEKLIFEAFEAAKAKNDIDTVLFGKAKMTEKVGMLKDYLPSILIENKEMYGILSKGIHELDEDTCLEHFGTVRLGIEMILEEKLVEYERNKRNEEAKRKIAELSAKVKSSSK